MATPKHQTDPSRPGYEQVDEIEDANGVMAIISKRLNSVPKHTIAIFKWYVQDGEKRKTSFFDLSQVDSVISVLQIASKRAAELQAECEKSSAAERGKTLADGVTRRQPA